MHSKAKDEEIIGKPLQSQQIAIDVTGFPSARYFQIHFEYIQEELQRSVKLTENLQDLVMQLDLRLQNMSDKKVLASTGPQLSKLKHLRSKALNAEKCQIEPSTEKTEKNSVL